MTEIDFNPAQGNSHFLVETALISPENSQRRDPRRAAIFMAGLHSGGGRGGKQTTFFEAMIRLSYINRSRKNYARSIRCRPTAHVHGRSSSFL